MHHRYASNLHVLKIEEKKRKRQEAKSQIEFFLFVCYNKISRHFFSPVFWYSFFRFNTIRAAPAKKPPSPLSDKFLEKQKRLSAFFSASSE